MEKIELSGCAIIENGKLLLLWKRKHSHFEFPGGKVEPGESAEQTAIRETREEIGCSVELMKDMGPRDLNIDGKNYVSRVFLSKILNGEIPKIMEPMAFDELIWMPINNHAKFVVAPNAKEFCEEVLRENPDITRQTA